MQLQRSMAAAHAGDSFSTLQCLSMSNKRRFKDPERVAGLLGLAFDADDGHKRITRGKNFLLAGGSEETHGVMRDTIIRVNEQLDARGLNLADVSTDELRDMLNDAQS
jgi:hypothetical protein